MRRNEKMANPFSTSVPFLGSLGFDENIESAIGDPDALMKTSFAVDVKKIIKKIDTN